MDDMSVIISNKKISFPFLIKILFIIIVLTIVLLFTCKVSLYNTYDSKVVKEGDDYYVQVFVPMDEQTFIHNEKILVDNKEYKYKIKQISDEYIFYNNNNYMVVFISISLDKSYMVENNYLKLCIKQSKKSLFNIILEKFKKGMNL